MSAIAAVIIASVLALAGTIRAEADFSPFGLSFATSRERKSDAQFPSCSFDILGWESGPHNLLPRK